MAFTSPKPKPRMKIKGNPKPHNHKPSKGSQRVKKKV